MSHEYSLVLTICKTSFLKSVRWKKISHILTLQFRLHLTPYQRVSHWRVVILYIILNSKITPFFIEANTLRTNFINNLISKSIYYKPHIWYIKYESGAICLVNSQSNQHFNIILNTDNILMYTYTKFTCINYLIRRVGNI